MGTCKDGNMEGWEHERMGMCKRGNIMYQVAIAIAT